MISDLTNTERNEGRHYYEQPIRVVKMGESRSIEINMMRHLMAKYRGKALDYAESLRRREAVIK